MSVTFWPNPRWAKTGFLRTPTKIYFIIFSICKSIDSEYSKTHDFEGKNSKWPETLPNTFFDVSEHLASFSPLRKKKPYIGADRGLTPPRLRTCPHLLSFFWRLPFSRWHFKLVCSIAPFDGLFCISIGLIYCLYLWDVFVIENFKTGPMFVPLRRFFVIENYSSGLIFVPLRRFLSLRTFQVVQWLYLSDDLCRWELFKWPNICTFETFLSLRTFQLAQCLYLLDDLCRWTARRVDEHFVLPSCLKIIFHCFFLFREPLMLFFLQIYFRFLFFVF